MMHFRNTTAFALVFSLCLATFGAGSASSARRQRAVSLVLFNGKVFTADARGTVAEAVAIDGARIVAVGTTRDIRAGYRGARMIDLRGRLVTPGFNDAHIHFLGGGLALLRVELNGAQTLAEAKRRVAERVAQVKPGAWILGRGWDHTLWGGEWPTREDLDEVAPNNPVFLQRVDGHVSWANTPALRQAGVTRETRAPEGGEILHDPAGEPTGILKETAAGLVGRIVPAPTDDERMRGRRARARRGAALRHHVCSGQLRLRDDEALSRASQTRQAHGARLRVAGLRRFDRDAQATARGVRRVQRRPAPSPSRRAQRLR